MKKLYRSKGTVHPSPPPPPSQQHISDHYLSFLPAAILTLTVALSPQDKQVLAYLISCSSSSPSYSSCHFPGSSRTTKNTNKSSSSSASAPAATNNKSGDHPPLFNCNCFRCYMSYWVRWDSSPNRQLIHEIIDAFEDSLVIKKETTTKSCKKDRRAKKVGSTTATCSTATESTRPSEPESGESDSVGDVSNSSGGEVVDEVEREEGYGDEKGSVRKIVSFLGERIWGVWT